VNNIDALPIFAEGCSGLGTDCVDGVRELLISLRELLLDLFGGFNDGRAVTPSTASDVLGIEAEPAGNETTDLPRHNGGPRKIAEHEGQRLAVMIC
jgi:hypothetical protein